MRKTMATNHIHHGDTPTTCEEHLIDAHGLDIDSPVAVDEEGGVAVFTLAGRIEHYREMLAMAQDFTAWTQPHPFRVVDTHGNHPPVYCWTKDAAGALRVTISRGYDPGSRYVVQERPEVKL